MNGKFLFLILLSLAGLGVLVYSATLSSAQPVVTVNELMAGDSPRKNIRLGARVAPKEIEYKTDPQFRLKFHVNDIGSEKEQLSASDILQSLPVIYQGIKPDTLQVGRDVILEGSWNGSSFMASSLLTQCPSKYEPPVAPKGSYQ